MNESYLKRSVAASLLGISEAEVYELARQKKLEWAEWGGGEIFITTESVRAMLEQQQIERYGTFGRSRAKIQTPSRQRSPARARPIPAKAPAAARPGRAARPRTLAEMRSSGVRIAGDEAVATAPVRDHVAEEIARLASLSSVRPQRS